MTDDIQKRKQEHLDWSLDSRVRGAGAGLENVQLPYDAMFSVSPSELDTRSRIAGIDVAFPLMMGAMTGGIDAAAPLNSALREIARHYGLAMELGSMRALMKNPELLATYGTGEVSALWANIGASEIAPDNAELMADLCEKLGASGLCIHLNGLQEWVQDGGNHEFTCSYDVLAAFIARFPMPVLLKEVGCGIGGKCAQMLGKLPIAGLETASRGGTSWVLLEAMRRQKPLFDSNLRALNRIGYDIQTSIRDCRQALGNRTVIASGGIEYPDELVKSLVLGADIVAMAQPLYRIWHDSGIDGLARFIDEFIETAKIIWRSTGCKNLRELQHR